jgi:hypothetical protein
MATAQQAAAEGAGLAVPREAAVARAAAAVGVARAALPRGRPRQLLRKQGEALAVQAEGPESKKPAAAVAPSKGAANIYGKVLSYYTTRQFYSFNLTVTATDAERGPRGVVFALRVKRLQRFQTKATSRSGFRKRLASLTYELYYLSLTLYDVGEMYYE